MTSSIVPRTNPPDNYYSVDDILRGHCPRCNADLTVTLACIDDHDEPCIVCEAEPEHFCQPIPARLAMEWDDLIHWQEQAFGLWEEDRCEEATQ